MKKTVISIAVGIIVIVAGIVLWKRHGAPAVVVPAPIAAPAHLASEADASSAAWTTLDGYLAAVQAHDVSALAGFTYKVSDTCMNAASTTDCYARMDAAAAIVKDLVANKASFTNVWYDDKQIILSTNYVLSETDVAYLESRKTVYLVRANDGSFKVLSILDPESSGQMKSTSFTKDEIIANLEKENMDTDKDGAIDQIETCTYQGVDTKTCVKTDPTKRDTDGNGWWDSVDALMKGM